MAAVLPLLCLALLSFGLRRAAPKREGRLALLAAAAACGVLTTAATELLSVFQALGPVSVALFWGVAAALAALLAARIGALGWRRPSPPTIGRPSTATVALAGPLVVIPLLTGLVAAFAWPNTSDALAYHLSRVMHWVQNGSVAFYPTHVIRQLFNPPWGEYATLHVALLTGQERLASFVQWLAMLGSLVGVSLIARLLGGGRTAQLASALFCATIPMGILQASSTQVDYVTAFWLVCLAAALLALRREPASAGLALLSGACLGLALLSKGTAYVYVAPLLAVYLIPRRGWPPAVWLRQLALVGLMALALNTPHYLRNLDLFGSPLGPVRPEWPEELQLSVGLRNDTIAPGLFVSNLARNAALHLGTPWPAVNATLERAIVSAHALLGLDPNDPRSTWRDNRFDVRPFNTNEGLAGNPLHLLLIVGALLALGLVPRLRHERPLATYGLAVLAAYLLFSLIIKWQPWQARLQLPLFVLWSPFVGLVLARYPRALAVAGVALFAFAWPSLLGNRSHPLLGRDSVPREGAVEQTFRYRPGIQASYVEATRLVRSDGCAEVGLIMDWDDWEYPFWLLLPGARDGTVRLEHVAVTNSSGVLAQRWVGPFVPCAVLAIGERLGDTLTVAGRPYRRARSAGEVKVFVPG